MNLKQQFMAILQRPGFHKSIKEIEGLRFFAIFLVMLQHFNERFIRQLENADVVAASDSPILFFISRGTVGVFLFFALSGFILSRAWISSHGTGSLSYSNYLIKRISRLEVPYVFWMSIFAIVLYFQHSSSMSSLLGHYFSSIFYVHNLVYNDYSTINPVAWSLEVELQFYLIAPFITLAFLKVPQRFRNTAFLVVFAILWLLQQQFGWWHFPFKASILGQLQFFLIGVLFAFNFQDLKLKKSGWYDLLFIVSWISLSFMWSADAWKNVIMWLSLYLLLHSAFHSVFINRILKQNIIVLIGGMCYTIYLTHLPLMELLTKWVYPSAWFHFGFVSYTSLLLISLILVIIFGLFAFVLIEKPFMFLPVRSPLSDVRETFKMLNVKRWRLRAGIFIVLMTLSTAALADGAGSRKDFQLRPLADLLDSVLTNNPRITRYDELTKVNSERIKITENAWLSSIALTGSALYGTGTLVDNTFNNDLNVTEQAIRLQTSNNSLYSAGLSFRLPLSTLFNTGHEKNVLVFQSNALIAEKNAMIILIREELINKYFDVINAYEKLEVANEALEANRMKLTVSEKFYTEGKLDIGLYKADLDNFYLSKSHKVDCESDFMSKYYVLKEFVGADIEVR